MPDAFVLKILVVGQPLPDAKQCLQGILESNWSNVKPVWKQSLLLRGSSAPPLQVEALDKRLPRRTKLSAPTFSNQPASARLKLIADG